MPSSRSRARARQMPLGKLTPTLQPGKVLHKALSLRDEMANCTLSDQAIALISMRLNTGASIAKLARGLGIEATNAYVMMRSVALRPKHLIAEFARTPDGGRGHHGGAHHDADHG